MTAPRNLDVLSCEPRPLQVIVTDRVIGGRESHDVIRRYPNPQGRACRLCDACTFLPGDDGQGCCVKSIRGPIDSARVAVLGVRGGRVHYGGPQGGDGGRLDHDGQFLGRAGLRCE